MSTNKSVKYLTNFISSFIILTIFSFLGCSSGGGSDSGSTVSGERHTVIGKVQKGSFIDGVIVATKLDDNGSLSSNTVQSTVDAKGRYTLSIPWSGLTHLSASGHYYDEYHGKNSSDEVEIEALYDVESDEAINLNLLSSLESSRIRELLALDTNFSKAKQETKDELEYLFSLSKETETTQLDMFDFNSSLSLENKSLLLLSATFLKITEEDSALATSAAKSFMTKGLSLKITPVSRFVSDFAKNGKVDSSFKKEWSKIIEDDPVSTLSKVEKSLDIEVGYQAPLDHWSKRVQLSVSSPRYIFDGSTLKKIIYDISVPLANYTDRSKVYTLSYDSVDGSAKSAQDYTSVNGEFNFTFTNNTQSIEIDILKQESESKTFDLHFSGVSEGLEITNPTLEVEILQNTISALTNPTLNTLALNSIEVDGMKSSVASSSSVLFSGSSASEVSLGLTLDAQTRIPAEYFANIYVTSEGMTPLFLQKVFMPTIGDVSSRVYYQSADISVVFDAPLRAFLADAYANEKEVVFRAEVVVDENSTISINSQSVPKFVQVSSKLGEYVELSTFEYLQEFDSSCNSVTTADGFDKNILYAEVDMYGMYERNYLNSPIGIEYNDVCVKMEYDESSGEYGLSLENGFGTLDSDMLVQVHGENVTFSEPKVSKDSIEVTEITLPLPDKHTLHHRDFLGNISPRGLSSVTFTPKAFSVSEDLSQSTLTGEFTQESYLHGKNLPLYFKLSKARLDSSGLSFVSSEREYLFGYSNATRSNVDRFSNPASGEYVFSVDEDGISSETPLAFNAHSIETHFPKMQSEVAAFEMQVKKSELVAKSLSLTETHSLAYQQNCPENECSSRTTEGTLALETNKTKLYSNGETLSSSATQKVSVAWGEKELQTVYARDHDIGVSIYTPGYILPTNEPEMVGEYLYGSVEEDSATLLMHPSSSKEAKSGEYNYAGVNVGAILHSQEPSLQTPSMSVALGDGVALELKNTQDTKYYVRAAGITGVFNNTPETINTILYGYDLNLQSFKFRQIANAIDEYTKIDGDVHVPGLGNFDVAFKNLAIDCSGNFRGGAIDPSQEKIMLGTWKMDSTLTSMAFKSPEANICSSRKNLWLGHLLKVAALKNRVELGTFWNPEGSPRDTVVTADTYNQLDGNATNETGEDNGGYNIALKDASFNFVDGTGGKRAWVETNAKVGLPFWGAKDMSVRMTNATPTTRELSVVTKEGELYIGERENTQTNEALAMDIRANYEQNISREIFNVVDFSLPAYYNSFKTDKTPSFIGRPFEKDLIVFKTNANIDEITPKTTRVSLGASANLIPLKDPKLHIDLYDPESLKNIDANLSFFFGETTVFQDSLGSIFDSLSKIDEVLNQPYSATLEVPFFLALKTTALLDEDDPYRKISIRTSKLLNSIVVVNEKVKREFYQEIMKVFNENEEFTAEAAYRLRYLVDMFNLYLSNLDRTIYEYKQIPDFQDDNSTLNKIHMLTYKYGLGTPENECTWENILKQQVVTFEDINKSIPVTNDYAITTKELVELARKIHDFNITAKLEATSFLKINEKYENFEEKMISLQAKIEDSKLDKVIKAYEKSVKWVDNKFCPRVDEGLDAIEDLNATLEKIDDTKRQFIDELEKLKVRATGSEMGEFIRAIEDINEDSNFTALSNQITDIYERRIAANLDRISALSKKIPRYSADEYRYMTVYGLMQLEAMQEFDAKFKEVMQPQVDKIKALALSLFGNYDFLLNETLLNVSGYMQQAIEESSARFSKIPLNSAELDGYAIFGDDEIHRLHMRASYTTAPDANASDSNTTEESSDSSSSGGSTGGGFGSDSSDEEKSKDDKESDLTFTAELDIINEAYEGTSGCGGENAQSNMKVSITTEDISMGIGKKKLAVDFLQLGVVLGQGEARIPKVKGVFGAITSDEGMEFSKFNLYNMGLAVGIGGNERFLGAKVSSTFGSMQLGMSFLVGEVCNEKIIQSILPETIGEFITIPEGRFKGYMVYGEGQTPVLEKPKVYAVGVRAKLGVWSLEGPPVIKGGLLGGGLFGYLSVVQIVGEMALLRESVGGDIRYAGDGWVAGGFGLKCDSKTWNTLEDVRKNNEKCTTVDMSFGLANEDEKWDAHITETRPKIPGIGGKNDE